jgi:gamma-glutamyl-gamma-aminobutyrate hydrolase PuuD
VCITPDDPKTISGLDGLLLTGGTDVNPRRYGEAPGPHTQGPDTERDELEARLLADALAQDLPVLAICRGMQLLNVVAGGTLTQHLGDSNAHHGDHPVLIQPGSRLAGIYGAGERVVNSRHHQAVREPGEGVAVTALAPDGIIEGIEIPRRRFVVGVQWHPEDRPEDAPLFAAFAAALAGPAIPPALDTGS